MFEQLDEIRIVTVVLEYVRKLLVQFGLFDFERVTTRRLRRRDDHIELSNPNRTTSDPVEGIDEIVCLRLRYKSSGDRYLRFISLDG